MPLFSEVLKQDDTPSFSQIQHQFEQDTNPNKVLLTMGMIYNEKNELNCLKSVQDAEKYLAENQYTKGYPNPRGIEQFVQISQNILQLDPKLTATVAAPACGALNTAFILAKFQLGITTVYTTSPSWVMYDSFVKSCGMIYKELDYYNSKEKKIDFQKLLQLITAINSQNSCLLLQASCTNPLGLDLIEDQFGQIAKIAKEKQLLVIVDIAYHGLRDDFEKDITWKPLYELKDQIILVQFYDKNLGIYNEGAGCVHIISQKQQLVQQHLESTISGLFGVCPVHGQHLATTVLTQFRKEYDSEITLLRKTIQKSKDLLLKKMEENQFCPNLIDFIKRQNGIFAYFALSEEQTATLAKKAVYLAEGGRVNLTGVTNQNVDYCVQQLKSIIQK